jgi:hypothetical protein
MDATFFVCALEERFPCLRRALFEEPGSPLRGWQISAIRGGLFRLIFTCESSQPCALDPAQVRFTEYDHVVEAVPSPNLADR